MNLNAADSACSSLEPTLPEKMRTRMAKNYEDEWEKKLNLDTTARKYYEEKEKAGTACVYNECLLTEPLLDELKQIALKLKSSIPDGSVLIQVGRSPWLLQEMMKALDLNVSWITMPFSHKIGFARVEYDVANYPNTPWAVEELPEPQKSWVTSYIKFLQNQLHITEEWLIPYAGRIYIVDYIASGESLQDALELVNKAIGVDLSITKIGFCDDDEPYPHWDKNPTNIFFTISKNLGMNMILKHALTADEAIKYGLAEQNPDSYFENAHGHTFYPAEWADPIALARVSEPAPLTLTAKAKRQQIIDFASSQRSDKK